MKILRGKTILFVFAFLFCLSAVQAQMPAVTVSAGYPVGRSASQVAYGNGRYVLLSFQSYNQVFQSATGKSWSLAGSNGLAATQLNFLAFGAGVFVVVGEEGIIQTSTDGENWTTQASGTTNRLNKVYFINNAFLAIGDNRTLLTSTDGITWNTVSFDAGAATDNFNSLSYGNGWYLLSARAGASGGSNAIVYRSSSAADNSWTVSSSAFSGEMINRIQFLKDRFWAFFAGSKMFTSANGASWTEITNAVTVKQPDNTTISWAPNQQIFNGVWDGTQYRFYGSSMYYSGYGSTFTSTDGVNFTLLPKTAYIVPQESAIINGTYFVCGNEGIVSSADGLTYQHSGITFNDMVKTANKYVGVGAISNDGQVYSSGDFDTWSSHTPAASRELYAVAYDGTRILAGGYTEVYSSTDEGDSWSKVYSNTDATFIGLAYGNGRFVAGGYDSETGCFLSYSADGGATWTKASAANNYYLKVKWVNNRFFALGTDNNTSKGRLLTSPDGIAWTDVTPDPGFDVYYFKDVAFDGAKYHVLGIDANYSFFTLSTATPDDAASYGNLALCSNTPAGVTLGGDWDQGVLEFSGGRFTGAVVDVDTKQDYIITSVDGSSWTALPQNAFSTITAAYASGTSVQLVGRGNALFTVSNGSTLPVGLLAFSGYLSGEGVQLQWRTATEQNAQQFTVQHSTDGTLWATLGAVKATGNSSSRQDYRFLHAVPVEGVNFYRLLLQDRDGQSSYSRVAVVQYGKALKASWFPNPVTSRLTIRTASAQEGLLTIFNTGGQPVRRARIAGYETSIDMSGLPAGFYVADVRQGSLQQKLQVIKQ